MLSASTALNRVVSLSTSQVINAFSPDLWRAVSDFDTTHQFNANWVYDVPFGHGRHWGGGAGKIVNGSFGGWGLNGLCHWTSGFPFTVSAGAGWATDCELSGTSFLTGPNPRLACSVTPMVIPRSSRIPVASSALADRVRWQVQASAQPCPGRLDNATSFAGPAISGLIWALLKPGTSVKRSCCASHGKFSTLPTPSALMLLDPSSTRIWSTSLVSANSTNPYQPSRHAILIAIRLLTRDSTATGTAIAVPVLMLALKI